ncbi:MAG: hypothetical protein EKE20_11290 [Candidatus Symbiopectobacterium sp. Dall1.0]|nr:hypothetical protein [Candidatus Symbiopectobacterium sp. Dall1.0]
MHIRQAGSVSVINSDQLQNVSSTVIDTKINLVNKLISAGNSSYDFKVKSDFIYRPEANKWNFKSLLEFFGFPKKEKDKELERILFEGKTLQHQAGLTRDSVAEKYMIHPPAFSLKNKKLAASALFLNYTLQNYSLADSSMLNSVNENKGHHYIPSGSSYYWYEKKVVDSHRFNQDTYNVDAEKKNLLTMSMD